MYEEYFDAAEDLDAEEALRRAYALGVASALDRSNQAAYDRLKDAAPDAYDESILELAYNQGRAEALELEGEIDGGTDSDTEERIWSELVESTVDTESRTSAGLPDALSRPEQELPQEGLPIASNSRRF